MRFETDASHDVNEIYFRKYIKRKQAILELGNLRNCERSIILISGSMNQNLGDISNVSTKEVNELFEFGGDEVRSHVKPVKMHLWRSSGQGQTRENDR